MRRRQIGRALCAVPLLVGAVLVIVSPAAAQTYWIDEITNYQTSGACGNTDLNTVTSSLKNRLDATGWSGTRFTNGNAWPQDFREPNLVSGGIEHNAADSKDLAIFAGHGNKNLLQWGTPNNGACITTPNTQTRLGKPQGDEAEYWMILASCVMDKSQLSNIWDSSPRQFLGYHNSPIIGDNKPRRFYNRTENKSNTAAWLQTMDENNNSPIVLSLGANEAHCQAILNGDKLFFPNPTAIPNNWGWWCIQYIDTNNREC